jgi:hypothetical protein
MMISRALLEYLLLFSAGTIHADILLLQDWTWLACALAG